MCSRYESQSQELPGKDGEAEAPGPHQRVLQSDLARGDASIPAGWAGHDGGRLVAGPRAGKRGELSEVA